MTTKQLPPEEPRADSGLSDEWLIKAAIKDYASDDLEFDDAVQPQISRADDCAWVASWVWVRYPEPEDSANAAAR